jgi:hypothetical protein
VWVLDNIIHNVGADGVAGSHYSNYTTKLCEDYYIGRNTIYTNGENGIDLKNVQGFIVSQNEVYGPFSRENGWGMVFHYGANSAFHPRNGAVIFNNIHHCSGGIYTGSSSGVDNMDVIGNKIWDIKRSLAVSVAPENGACIQIDGSTAGANSIFRIVDNTFHDYDRGLLLVPSAGDAIKVHGNIFSARSDPAYYEVEVPNGLQMYVTLDYNLYDGTPAFRWQNLSRTLSYLRTTALQETHALTGSPLFVNPSTGDFHLSKESMGINMNVEGPLGDTAYAAYQARFGVDIKRDFDGRSRPVDGVWDIGAFESIVPPSGAKITIQVDSE